MSCKIVLSILVTAILYGNVAAQTLFTYGNDSVSKQEFLKDYHKNAVKNETGNDDINYYLHLYIAYKLKVKAARDLKIDTFSSFKADVENYKSLLQSDLLKDEQAIEVLVKEAIERSKKDIDILCYFIPRAKADSVPDGREAIEKLHQLLVAGTYKESKFEKETGIAPAVIPAGYITVFSLPYEFENIAYSLKPGEISERHQTDEGWYIFKNLKERKAAGTIHLAQILVYAPGENKEELLRGKSLADSIYLLLQKGSDFEELARQYSNDKSTAANGGYIPPFETGTYSRVFTEKAFSVSDDGTTLPPFKTELGYHIIRRISLDPVPDTANESYREKIRQKVLENDRMEVANQSFLKRIKGLTGALRKDFPSEDLWKITDSAIISSRNVNTAKLSQNTPVISFNNGSYKTVNDWIMFATMHFNPTGKNFHEKYENLFEEFFEHNLVINYKNRLPEYSPQYKERLEEYMEGNLLFEVMQQQVWSKTPGDENPEELSAYQARIEKEWVEQLKKKYEVKLYKDVLRSL